MSVFQVDSSAKWEPVVKSKKAQHTSNPIRKIMDNIKLPPKDENKPLIPLSLGDPCHFSNLAAPDELVNTLTENIRSAKHNGYAPSAGVPAAREAVAKCYSCAGAEVTKDDVFLASGCSGALELALSVLLNEGDNLLVPKPGFPLYQVIAESLLASVKHYNLLPETGWEADLAHMESLIDANTKAILLNNPSNPCGSVFSKQHLENILKLAEKYRLPVVSDEIYGKLVFGEDGFYPAASLTTTVPVLAVGGLAKEYVCPGWRVGWVMVHDRNGLFKDVRQGLADLTTIVLGANSIVQSAIPAILTPEPGSDAEASVKSFSARYLKILCDNAKFTTDRLGAVDGLNVVVPSGAMYVMVGIDVTKLAGVESDVDFANKLLNEEQVFVLPGKCFGMPNYFRVVTCGPQETLANAYERIEKFCASKKK